MGQSLSNLGDKLIQFVDGMAQLLNGMLQFVLQLLQLLAQVIELCIDRISSVVLQRADRALRLLDRCRQIVCERAQPGLHHVVKIIGERLSVISHLLAGISHQAADRFGKRIKLGVELGVYICSQLARRSDQLLNLAVVLLQPGHMPAQRRISGIVALGHAGKPCGKLGKAGLLSSNKPLHCGIALAERLQQFA